MSMSEQTTKRKINAEENFEEIEGEFAKVRLSEKLAYCIGDPALTVVYTLANTLLVYFYNKCHRTLGRNRWYDHAGVQSL